LEKHLWKRLVLPVVVLVAAAVVGNDLLASRSPVILRTTVRLFASVPDSGLPISFRGRSTARGMCLVESLTDPSPDAYRCFADNHMIYDPCFAGFPGAPLLCVEAPWSAQRIRFIARRIQFVDRAGVITLNLSGTQPYPAIVARYLDRSEAAAEKDPPWALQLSNGARCVFDAGQNPEVEGERLNYSCGQVDGQPPWVVGVPDRGSEPWTVSFLRLGSSQTSTLEVAVAWY
jgi:hypothetical protein